MKKIDPLKIKIRHSLGQGFFHDSRGDVANLAKAINAMVEKQNEIIQAVNKLIDKEAQGA